MYAWDNAAEGGSGGGGGDGGGNDDDENEVWGTRKSVNVTVRVNSVCIEQ